MKELTDVITELKDLHDLKKNFVPMKQLFRILGKYLYEELPHIKRYIYTSWFWKNKVVSKSYGNDFVINKDGDMQFTSHPYRTITLDHIIDYLEMIAKLALLKYYNDDDVRRLSVIIKNISGKDE